MNLIIVYSSDDNYAQHTGVSILSVLDNNRHFKNIDIYVIDNDISNENKNRLNDIVNKYNRNINYIEFEKYKQKLKLDMKWDISISAYARLFISSILPNNIDKVLYFDCDTIIVNKLDELWNIDIKDYYVAGVGDTVSIEVKESVGMDREFNYINSGMLLINLKKWREDYIENQFIEFIDKHRGCVNHHDQGVINGVLYKKCKLLHPKFNIMTTYYTMKRKDIITYYGISNGFYTQEEIDDALNNPVYIHYTPGFTTRPWIKGCKHPKKEIYLRYLDNTPWNYYVPKKDNSKFKIKFINSLYRNLPFNIANTLVRKLMKIK